MFSLFGNSIESEYETLKQKCFEQEAELSLKTQEIQELKKERQSLLDQLHINQLAFQKEISQLKDHSLQKDLESLNQLQVEQVIEQKEIESVDREDKEVRLNEENRQLLLNKLRDHVLSEYEDYEDYDYESSSYYIHVFLGLLRQEVIEERKDREYTEIEIKVLNSYLEKKREAREVVLDRNYVSGKENLLLTKIISTDEEEVRFFVTDKNVYIFAEDIFYDKNFHLVYTFTTELDTKSLKLLICLSDVDTDFRDADIIHRTKQCEDIIRMIPGSYQNGPWKQVNGFFGSYFNEETCEIDISPPYSYDPIYVNHLSQEVEREIKERKEREIEKRKELERKKQERKEREEKKEKEIYSYFKNEPNGPKGFKSMMHIQQNHTPHGLKMVKMCEYISREVILFYHGSICTSYNIPHIAKSDYICISVVFTKKNIYRIVIKYINDNWRICLCPLYTFSNELDAKSLIILKNIKESGSTTSFKITDTSINISNLAEKAIRMIPGSYQFRPWKELNGFFGSYFNEETFEISTSPHLDI